MTIAFWPALIFWMSVSERSATSSDRAVLDDREERIAGAAGNRADLGIAHRDHAGDGRLHAGPGELQIDIVNLRIDDLDVGFTDRDSLFGGVEPRLRNLDGRRCLFELRYRAGAALAEFLEAVTLADRVGDVGLSLDHLRLILRDGGPSLRLVRLELALLEKQRVFVQRGEHAFGLHLVADIGIQRLDRQGIDERLDINLLDGPDRAGGDDAIDERLFDRFGHNDRGQLDFRLHRGGLRRLLRKHEIWIEGGACGERDACNQCEPESRVTGRIGELAKHAITFKLKVRGKYSAGNRSGHGTPPQRTITRIKVVTA